MSTYKVFVSLLLLLISLCFNSFAHEGADIEVSLLTCGTGTSEVYEAFGHTAIRIKNHNDGTDVVYNYGMFNFYEEDFLLKFVRGKLLYYVDVENFNDFLHSYIESGRSVREQVLNLNVEQKTQLQKALNENLLPENKYYLYDFIYNNCSTQPRDILKKSIGEDFYFETLQSENTETIRELIDKHTTYNEWLDFGIDLLLGVRTDKIADKDTRMFLPEELMIEFDSTSYQGKSIVREARYLYDGQISIPSKPIHPTIFFSVILIVIVLLQVYLPSHSWQYPTAIGILSIAGIVGWILVFMWVGTDHYLTKWNLNLLWANPLYFPLVFLFVKSDFIGLFFKVSQVILILLLVAWYFNPQQFHISVVPIMLILLWAVGVRSEN